MRLPISLLALATLAVLPLAPSALAGDAIQHWGCTAEATVYGPGSDCGPGDQSLLCYLVVDSWCFDGADELLKVIQ